MKEEIYEKLEHMSDLDQRIVLKNILEGVFSALYDHTEEMYSVLEQRVFDEIEYVEGRYNIYTSIVSQKDIDLIHDFLYPMNANDLSTPEYNMDMVLENLLNEKKTYIFKVFFQCDYLIFKQILNQNKRFKGSIRTDKKVYTAYFELEKDESYTTKIENMYRIFIENQIPWHTINAPYINKIAKVNLINTDEPLNSQEKIEEIIIDFGEYSQYIKYNMIPVWNIQKLSVMGMGFAMPCEEEVFYEHKIPLSELGIQHGYLVDSKVCRSIRHTRQYLYVTTDIEDSMTWDIYKLAVPSPNFTQGHYYPIMTNARKVNFLDKIGQQTIYPIKTKAEIIRLLNILEAAQEIELGDINIIEASAYTNCETYNLNPFIIDEIRESNYKKILLLGFYSKGENSYVIRDILSFIVSEIQHYYPEYRCEGRLL